MQKQPSIFGGACIIASVCVGAGMLALPISGAGAWSGWTVAVIIMTMCMMTLGGWLLLEAYKPYELRASFNTVTRDLLGNSINIINNLAVYFVGGILLYAYITTMGDTLHSMSGERISSAQASILACLIGSAFVWHSTRAVDRISVLLIVFMVCSFLFSVFGLLGNIKLELILDSAHRANSHYAPYIMVLLPAGLVSFGYHHSVTSMRAYYGEERKAAKAILYGTLIATAIYLVWIIAIFGNLPRPDFVPVIAEDSVPALYAALGSVLSSEAVKQTIAAFTLAAVVSSFIGVGLGVFDYLADLFHFDNSAAGRTKSWLITFLPPLLLSLKWPMGFTLAIGYAGAVATIWTCITPALLVWKSRRNGAHSGSFRVPGGKLLIALLLLYGVLTALFHLLNLFGKLPVYSG